MAPASPSADREPIATKSDTSSHIKYLKLSDTFQPSAEKAISAITTTVTSDVGDSASLFKPPEECQCISDEIQALYQKEQNLPEKVPFVRADGVVLRDIWKAGGLQHVVIVPLANVDNAKVIAWSEKREESFTVDWVWKKAIFTPELTFFEVEKGKKVGALVVRFNRP